MRIPHTLYERHKGCVLSCFVFLLGLLSHASCLHGEYVYDDNPTVRHNPVSRLFIPLRKVWEVDYWGSSIIGTHTHGSYRPLTTITFAINTWINELVSGKTYPDMDGDFFPAWTYRLASLLLHATICLRVFKLYRRLTNNLYYSFLGSLLFACHPVTTEAICCIACRADLLAALCTVLAIEFAIAFWNCRTSLFAFEITNKVGEFESRGSAQRWVRKFSESQNASAWRAWRSLTLSIFCTIVGTFCKETGLMALGIAMAFFVIAYLAYLAFYVASQSINDPGALLHRHPPFSMQLLPEPIPCLKDIAPSNLIMVQQLAINDPDVELDNDGKSDRPESRAFDHSSKGNKKHSDLPLPFTSRIPNPKRLLLFILPVLVLCFAIGIALFYSRILIQGDRIPSFSAFDNIAANLPTTPKLYTLSYLLAYHVSLFFLPSPLIPDYSAYTIDAVASLFDSRNLFTLFVLGTLASVVCFLLWRVYRPLLSVLYSDDCEGFVEKEKIAMDSQQNREAGTHAFLNGKVDRTKSPPMTTLNSQKQMKRLEKSSNVKEAEQSGQSAIPDGLSLELFYWKHHLRFETAEQIYQRMSPLSMLGVALFGIAFALVSILPGTSILFTVGFTIAERILYLPLIGVCLSYTALLVYFMKTPNNGAEVVPNDNSNTNIANAPRATHSLSDSSRTIKGKRNLSPDDMPSTLQSPRSHTIFRASNLTNLVRFFFPSRTNFAFTLHAITYPILLGVFAILSYQQGYVWKSEHSLWSHTISQFSTSTKAWYSMGHNAGRNDDPLSAILYYSYSIARLEEYTSMDINASTTTLEDDVSSLPAPNVFSSDFSLLASTAPFLPSNALSLSTPYVPVPRPTIQDGEHCAEKYASKLHPGLYPWDGFYPDPYVNTAALAVKFEQTGVIWPNTVEDVQNMLDYLRSKRKGEVGDRKLDEPPHFLASASDKNMLFPWLSPAALGEASIGLHVQLPFPIGNTTSLYIEGSSLPNEVRLCYVIEEMYLRIGKNSYTTNVDPPGENEGKNEVNELLSSFLSPSSPPSTQSLYRKTCEASRLNLSVHPGYMRQHDRLILMGASAYNSAWNRMRCRTLMTTYAHQWEPAVVASLAEALDGAQIEYEGQGELEHEKAEFSTVSPVSHSVLTALPDTEDDLHSSLSPIVPLAQAKLALHRLARSDPASMQALYHAVSSASLVLYSPIPSFLRSTHPILTTSSASLSTEPVLASPLWHPEQVVDAETEKRLLHASAVLSAIDTQEAQFSPLADLASSIAEGQHQGRLFALSLYWLEKARLWSRHSCSVAQQEIPSRFSEFWTALRESPEERGPQSVFSRYLERMQMRGGNDSIKNVCSELENLDKELFLQTLPMWSIRPIHTNGAPNDRELAGTIERVGNGNNEARNVTAEGVASAAPSQKRPLLTLRTSNEFELSSKGRVTDLESVDPSDAAFVSKVRSLFHLEGTPHQPTAAPSAAKLPSTLEYCTTVSIPKTLRQPTTSRICSSMSNPKSQCGVHATTYTRSAEIAAEAFWYSINHEHTSAKDTTSEQNMPFCRCQSVPAADSNSQPDRLIFQVCVPQSHVIPFLLDDLHANASTPPNTCSANLPFFVDPRAEESWVKTPAGKSAFDLLWELWHIRDRFPAVYTASASLQRETVENSGEVGSAVRALEEVTRRAPIPLSMLRSYEPHRVTFPEALHATLMAVEAMATFGAGDSVEEWEAVSSHAVSAFAKLLGGCGCPF